MTTNTQERHVIFGTGPVGRSIMTELLKKDKQVCMVNRSGKANVPPQVEVIKGDARDPATTTVICKGATTVYNCTNPPYTQWPELFPVLQTGIVEGATAAKAKLVVMENLYMYGPTGGKPLTENLPYAPTTRKGETRAKMAQELLDLYKKGTVKVTMGRAADFFGPGALVSAMGERVFYPALAGKSVQLLGNPDLPHTQTYVPDIGKALVILGEHEEAFGQAWHIPSPKTVTPRQFVEMIGTEIGQPLRIQAIPKFLLKLIGLFNAELREVNEMLYQFEEPFIMDHSKFEQAFGNHATPLEEAIKATVAWFKVNPQ